MNKKNILAAVLLLLLITMTVQSACTSAAPPVQFEVISLDIQPREVTVGETAVISAQVTNTGGTGGVYFATLSVDGKKASTKDINVEPGSYRTVTFTLSKDQAGTYEIMVGKRTAILTVSSKMAAKPMEIGHDNGVAKDYLALVKPATGYSVSFVSPANQFTINQVRVFGLVYGSPGFHMEASYLQIWDKDKKVLYNGPFPGEQLPLVTRLGDNSGASAGWANVDVPNIDVKGDFYIHIYTGIPAGQGIRMGANSSVANTHSDVTVRDDNGIDNFAPNWPYTAVYWYGDKSLVNWMIRVAGIAMVPQQ